jgi:transcriptional regulator with PAS, ATPase and Fis domain
MSLMRRYRPNSPAHLVAAHSAPDASSDAIKRWLKGDSPQMAKVGNDIRIAAPADITVLINGEPGTGKELAAQALHHLSKRARGPFIVVNCGGLTESLLESELFGYVRGAFTGAGSDHKGLFEKANGGSIFLDEIGEMPLAAQVRLLRVLQERKIRPVGAHEEREIDIRVIAATNKDLEREVREGRFREDLYYRLNWFPIRMPALREHPSDIPLLIEYFLESRKLENGGLELMCGHHWPGNVRELMAAIERMRLRAGDSEVISIEQIREALKFEETNTPSQYTFTWQPGISVEEFFAEQLQTIYRIGLVLCENNHSKTARLLGMDRTTLDRQLERAHCVLAEARSRSEAAAVSTL